MHLGMPQQSGFALGTSPEFDGPVAAATRKCVVFHNSQAEHTSALSVSGLRVDRQLRWKGIFAGRDRVNIPRGNGGVFGTTGDTP